MEPREVYYFSRFVPSYRRPILALLNERLDGRLIVCSGAPPKTSSLTSLQGSGSGEFREIRLRNFWFRGEKVHYQSYRRALSKAEAPAVALLEESPRSLSLPPLLKKCRRRGIPSVLWGHFSSNKRELGSSDARDRYRMGMAERADAVVTYTQEIARQLKETLDPEKIFVAQNTLDTHFLFSEYDRLHLEGKTSVRRRLDLPDRHIVLYLGRLIEEKGTRQIINIVNRLSTDKLLLVIGEGPERRYIERAAHKKGVDVRFTGSINDDRELAPFIYASDVLLNPGYVGLSVVHAFALGVPIVAPAPSGPGRYHSPEWVHVRSGENGLLVDDPTEERMSTAVRDILADQVLYSEAAQKYARESLSIDRMLDGLMEAIQYVSSKQ